MIEIIACFFTLVPAFLTGKAADLLSVIRNHERQYPKRQMGTRGYDPPESELVARYNISRTTIRQVLEMLVNKGLIYRERGRGSFVPKPTLEEKLLSIISFTDDMRQRERKTRYTTSCSHSSILSVLANML